MNFSISPSYWLKNEPIQNFGDFLTEFLLQKLFLSTGMQHHNIWLIGSCISDYHIELSLKEKKEKVIFWGCGMRESKELKDINRNASHFLAVRGPLSRDLLKLGDDIPIGDPALLMPALYSPSNFSNFSGKSLLIPHFNDLRNGEELRKLTGCDIVLRPNISNNLNEINKLIDAIVSSDFVLCSSLHAAIIAVAYQKPFGYWDSGFIDVPFKWKDFSESINIPCKFFSSIEPARNFYKSSIHNKLKLPILWPLIASAPLAIRPEKIIKILELDFKRNGEEVFKNIPVNFTSDLINENIIKLININNEQYKTLEIIKKQNLEKDENILNLNKNLVLTNESLFQKNKYLEDKNQYIADLTKYLEDKNQYIIDLTKYISEITKYIDDKEKIIQVLNQYLDDKNQYITDLTKFSNVKDESLKEKDQSLKEKDQSLKEKDQSLKEKDQSLKEKDESLKNKDESLKEKDESLKNKDEKIQALNQYLVDKNQYIADLNRFIEDKDKNIQVLNQYIDDKNQYIADLNRFIEDKDKVIFKFNKDIYEADGKINTLISAVSEKDFIIKDQFETIERIKQSKSWILTSPLRLPGKILRNSIGFIRKFGILTRFTIITLTFPSSLVFYSGFRPLTKKIISRDKRVVSEIFNNQNVLKEKLLPYNKLVKDFVLITFFLALRIQREGGIRRFVLKTLKLLKYEGFSGIKRKIRNKIIFLNKSLPPSSYKGKITKSVAKKVLISDLCIPREDISAGERATLGIIKDFCYLGYDVFFLPLDMLPSPNYQNALEIVGAKVITNDSGFKYPEQFIKNHGKEFGIYYLIRVDVAEVLIPEARKIAPSARIIFHSPDLNYLRVIREAELKKDPVAKTIALETRSREFQIMKSSDSVVCVSPKEYSLLKDLIPEVPISIFTALYSPLNLKSNNFSSRKNIFFLGGFKHSPNLDAVKWFIDEIWPHVKKFLPGVEFHIIGSEIDESLDFLKQKDIKIIGSVPNLREVLKKYRIGIAPLRYGAGIKGKIGMTLGEGIPCVCTTIAAEGMGLKNKINSLIEDEPFSFAKALAELYEDKVKWNDLVNNGKKLIKNKFSESANLINLMEVLNQSSALPIPLFIDHCKNNLNLTQKISLTKNPDISIIIYGCKDWQLCRERLFSSINLTLNSELEYELILVDDGKLKNLKNLKKTIPYLRIIKVDKEITHTKSFNKILNSSKGKYFLILNYNFIILPAAIKNLYFKLENDNSAAIVGSKLIDVEENIIEAGAGLFMNSDYISIGSQININNQKEAVNRNEKFFNISREVDLICKSPFLIRRSFWDIAGGCNENFEHTYFSLNDLTLRARSMSLRIIYEPLSEVVSVLNNEESNFLTSNHSQYEEDKLKFIKKWSNILEKEHLPVEKSWHQIVSCAERRTPLSVLERRESKKLNVLYFTPFPSHPSSHGNQSTIQQFAKRFQSLGHKVHFALLESCIYNEEDVLNMKEAWDTFDILPNEVPLWSNGQPIEFDGWYQSGLGELIRVLCDRYEIDIVFCSYIFQSKLLEFVPDYILKVIDTHDKMGDRYDMLRQNNQPLEFFSCTQKEEGTYLKRADIVVARRAEEASYFNSVTGKDSAIVIPHVEDPKFIDKRFSKLEKVGIVASANLINLAIVKEFLSTIDSKIKNNIPFNVHVAGQIKNLVKELPSNEQSIFKSPWVKMHGFVDEIKDFYEEMDIIISPVTMGTGINVKTVQAMAYGMPLLTTKCGIKGIETGEVLHEHNDLDSLVDNLIYLTKNIKELDRLALISQERYNKFFEDASDMIKKLFSFIKLKKFSKQNLKASHSLIIERDKEILKEKIHKVIWNYYKEKDKKYCFSDSTKVKMDGENAESWVIDSLKNNQLHDEDYSIFKLFAEDNGTILDIGANWGYSVASIWSMCPKFKIVSFEPILGYKAPLQKIKESFTEKYDYRMFGLGSSNKVIKFAIPVINGIANSALTSASEDRKIGEIDCLAEYIAEYALNSVDQTIPIEFSMFEFLAPIKRLDDVIKEDNSILDGELKAIKIDAEGLEAEILFGSKVILKQHQPLIMLEGGNRYDGLTKYMEKLGYRYYEREGTVLKFVNKTTSAANGFYIHNDRISTFSDKGFVFI